MKLATLFYTIFTTGYLFWKISTWQKETLLLKDTFSSGLFWSELPFFKTDLCYGQRELGDWWETCEEWETKKKRERQKELWQSLDWREISDVWKHIQQSRLCFVIQRVRRQRRGEEKEQCVSDSLKARKASESSSKVRNLTPELVWKSPLHVS